MLYLDVAGTDSGVLATMTFEKVEGNGTDLPKRI